MTDQNLALEALIKNVVETLDTATLIDKVRGAFDIPPIGAESDGTTVKISDAVQAALINELLAQAADAKRVRDTAAADYEACLELLAEITGEHEILKVHNAPVFSYKKAADSRQIDVAYVKSKFPDIEGNEAYYKDVTGSRRRLIL